MKIYERIIELTKDLRQIVFFELGACDGLTTKELIGLIKDNPYQYYAFEPDLRRIPGMKNHVGEFVHIIPKAIGAIDGLSQFYFSNIEYFGSGSLRVPTPELLKDFPRMKFEEGEVDVVRLDTFCHDMKIEHIDFIWSDIQGAEIDLIEGGRKMLERTDYLYTEYNNGPAYEGNLDLKGILDRLPGWVLIEDYDGDALLKNERSA